MIRVQPIIKPLTRTIYTLEADFHYKSTELDIVMDIAEGFMFDGASIPRILWTTTGSPFMPENIGPGMLHDYLYKFHKDTSGRRVSRKKADQVFKEALGLNDKSRYQKYKMYTAVRTFGWMFW